MGKLFPSLKQQQQLQQQQHQLQQQAKDKEAFERVKQQQQLQQQQQQQQHVNGNADLLKQKLTQLETEIERFQKKNTELASLKEKCELELRNAELQQKLFDKQKEEEHARLRDLHDEEMRKLKLEKKIFEQYKQSIKETPDRRERDEIERLRKQLSELADEFKLKESRWMANNNRLKERIEALEQEKHELKQELQLIEKQRIDSLMQTNQPHAFNGDVPKPLKANLNQVVAPHLPTAPNCNPMQPNPNIMLLKRSISEKSLSSSTSSSSSSCSSSSSASIGSSTGSSSTQAVQSNYFHQETNQMMPQQSYASLQPVAALNYAPSLSSRKSFSPTGVLNQKSVKFKLDYQPQQPLTEYDKESSQNTSNNSSYTGGSTCSNSEELVSTQGGGGRQVRVRETRHFDDKHVEKYLEDGTTLTVFPNGTVKEVSGDKRCTFVKFFNGDRKEMNHDTGTETYFYAETNITQIIYSNGMQILKFPSGQVEKHHTNKTREIIFPDKICKFIYADGSEESRLPNGTCIKVDPHGDKIIEYPNRQREIHTKEYKRREYPDGSIKTVYTNGISETRYANGRVRVKDLLGNIISDKKA